MLIAYGAEKRRVSLFAWMRSLLSFRQTKKKEAGPLSPCGARSQHIAACSERGADPLDKMTLRTNQVTIQGDDVVWISVSMI